MANRRYNNQQFTMTPGAVGLFANVSFGAAGAPTLNVPFSKGVISVTRNSAGDYTFVFGTKAGFLDCYNKLLLASHVFNSGSSAPASPQMYIKADNSGNPAVCSIEVVFANAGVATDPASGEVVLLKFDFKNSSAP